MSSRNYFSSEALDRAGHLRRDGSWLEARLADPTTRVVSVRASTIAVDGEQRLARVAGHGAGLDHAAEGIVFLGLDDDGTAVFAVDLGLEGGQGPAIEAALADDHQFVDLRGAASRLPAAEGHRAAYASAMFTWHRRHRWCGTCGAATVPDWAGHVRRCPDCGFEQYPRTDPVVIMVIGAGDDHCLLGRQAAWAPRMWSALAGFVEPGESLEDAVAREVMEETGVTVVESTYHSSQPWPFPLSLMLGFHGSAGPEPTTIVVDESELADARWISRSELAEGIADGGLTVPPPFSIARNLIDTWVAAGE